MKESLTAAVAKNVVLVDGYCVFCNALVRNLMRFDRQSRFYFAHLQSDVARDVIARHSGAEPDIDAIYLVTNFGTDKERLLIDGAAGKMIWSTVFPVLFFLRFVPTVLLDPFYKWFGKIRYKLFGKYESCLVPTAELRKRFVD